MREGSGMSMQSKVARVALGLVLAGLMVPATAMARRPFTDTDLFTGHAIRQSSKDRKIAAGINVHTAPVAYVGRKALTGLTGGMSLTYPEAPTMGDVLQLVDAGAVEELAKKGDVAATKAKINADLKAAGISPTDAQKKAIDGIEASKLGDIEKIAGLVDATDSPNNSALVFGLEPWFEYNFGTYDLTASVPVGLFVSDDGNEFAFGNVNLDLRAGSRWSPGAAGAYLPISIGWTGGVSLYLPTGTEVGNRVALSNPLAFPKYLHEYATIQPYGIFGLEAAFLSVLLRLEYSHMQAVRGKPAYDQVGYLGWGVSTILRIVVFDFVAELDGLKEVYDAPAMNDIYLTLGGRLNVGPVRMGLGARMPITKHDGAANAQSLGVGMANVASVNFLLQGILTF